MPASRFDFDRDQPLPDNRPERHEVPEAGERLWPSTRLLVAIAAVIGVFAVASAVGAFAFAGHDDSDGNVGDAAVTAGPGESAPEVAGPSEAAPSEESIAAPTPSPSPTMAARTGPTVDPIAAAEAEVVVLVNRERARVGCQPLAVDTRLGTAARRHSVDMARRGYFSHTTPEGVTFSMRITNAGYRWSYVGENIASVPRTAVAVMRVWMDSPGHRANILNCRFRHIGVGLAYNSHRVTYWTQDFGTPG